MINKGYTQNSTEIRLKIIDLKDKIYHGKNM